MSFLKTNSAIITVGGVSYDSLDDLDLAIQNTDYIGDVVCSDENMISVPGKSGMLDFTDSVFGGSYFHYRPIKIIFGGICPTEEWDTRIADIRNKFHGKVVNIRFRTLDNYYFTGRVTIEGFTRKRGLGKFNFCINFADPWMYKVKETVKTVTPTSTGITINCINSRMPVIPTFVTTSSCTVQYGSITKSIGSAGTHKFNDIILKEGSNNLKIKGTSGTVIIKYREGSL